MMRWVEHKTKLYARENVVIEDTVNVIECLPELGELDREPAIEQPVKSLGRWYSGTLSDRSQGVAIMQQAEHGLKAIDRTKLPGKHKIWCQQVALYPRLAWQLTIYEVALSRVEMIERTCNTYIRKWLGLPRTINTSSLYRQKGALQLPLSSIVEIYKAGKVRTVMMLRESRD